MTNQQTTPMEWMDAILYLIKRVLINSAGALLAIVAVVCGGAAIYANSKLWWGVLTEWSWDWGWFQGGAIFGGIAMVCALVSVFLFSLKKQKDKA
jgi:hypothetical protein